MPSAKEQQQYSALERNAAVLAMIASAGLIVSTVLHLLNMVKETALNGLFGAIAMLCFAVLIRKRSRLLMILLIAVAVFSLYTAAEVFFWNHYGIYIGSWHQLGAK